MTAFEWAVPLLGALVTAAGALWLRWSGRQIERAKHERDTLKAEIDAHDRITDAPTGIGASDADRVKRLRDLADRWGD